MGSLEQKVQPAILRYIVPDLSVPAKDRSFFAFPANKEVVDTGVQLRDFRTDPDIVRGPAGLDVQGFTYIAHESALAKSDGWYEGQNVEEIYLPEVEALICKVTGAKRAVVNNVAFRRREAEKQVDHSFFYKRDCDLDRDIGKLPKDQVMVYGKEVGASLEPARGAHIDYSVLGLQRTARYCRHDIRAAAQEALAAEDAGGEVPRYAAYSVWRPVQTVRKDPLAVCDWRSVDKPDLCKMTYRALSDSNKDGEYIMEAYSANPPKQPNKQRWYWMPEQKPDEVLIIKFADTASEHDPNIAGGCPHASPIIPGTEGEEPRCSIEARVLAFW